MANTLAPRSGRSMPVDLDQQFDHFLDALRQEQVAFLDSMRSLCMPLGSCSGSLAAAASSQARLTQQFLDAQRSLLRRTAEYDTAALDIERSAAEDARQMVIGAANYALDCGVPTDTLDSLRWTSLDATRPIDDGSDADAAEVASRHQQELSALLDRWWAETLSRGTSAVDRANSFASHVRGRADDRVSQILEAVARHTAPRSAEAPADGSAFVTSDLLAALDTTDSSDLGRLLDSMLLSLGGNDVASPDLSGSTEADAPRAAADLSVLLDALEAEMAATTPITAEIPIEAVGAADAALIQLGQRAADPAAAPAVGSERGAAIDYGDDDPAGPLAVLTRVVLPMLAAVGAAVALLAWMG